MIGCKILIRGEYGRLLPSLLGCHMTYILHDARFKNFSHIIHVWPKCSQKAIDFQQKESNFYLVTDEEMVCYLNIYSQNCIHAHFELMVGLNPSLLVLYVIIIQGEFEDTKG